MERLDQNVEQVRPHTAKISWSTASEINNAGFSIKKSADGREFEEIGFVESKS